MSSGALTVALQPLTAGSPLLSTAIRKHASKSMIGDDGGMKTPALPTRKNGLTLTATDRQWNSIGPRVGPGLAVSAAPPNSNDPSFSSDRPDGPSGPFGPRHSTVDCDGGRL